MEDFLAVTTDAGERVGVPLDTVVEYLVEEMGEDRDVVEEMRKLVSHLVRKQFDGICRIFSVLNGVSVDEIAGWKRSEANGHIMELFTDEDLVSFFMSAEALAQAVQSVTLPEQLPSRPKLRRST